MLRISHLNKYFGSFHVTQDVNLSVASGTIFGLLGPNGAGKTTIIRMINNIYIPESGTITWNDTNLLNNNNRRLTGYLPEERGLYPKMTVMEVLRFFAEIKGVPVNKELTQKILEKLEQFQIKDSANAKIHTLSKGMQQKVQIIAPLLHDPELIIFDEPFTGLDPVNTRTLKDLIHQLASEGKTVILSTHRMEQAEELCQNIALVSKGQIILDGSVEEIKLNHRTNTYFLKTASGLPDHIPGEITHQTHNTVTFTSQPTEVTPFLKQTMESHDLIDFHEVLPTLEDIFIEKVSN